MDPFNQPLAGIARPATDAMQARLARVNRGGSGITGIMRGNGTPFLTNRPETVDELSDPEVGSVIGGGQGDPRSLLKQFIVANDNVGLGNAINMRAREPLMDTQAGLQVESVKRGFGRDQKRMDTNSEAATAFDAPVSRLRQSQNEQALAEADIKNQGDYAQAAATRYKADADYDIAAEKNTMDADASDFESILQGYGDALAGVSGVQDPAAREQALAPIRSLLIRLLQGQTNANQQP